MTLTVKANERGVVRVFALSMREDEAKALRENVSLDDNPSPQEIALGVTYLNSDFTEVFPVTDLDDLGLSGYLEVGNGIDPAQIAPDKRKLDALDGYVFIVYSSAFGGKATTLTPAPELTHIGTYSEPGIDWAEAKTLTSDAAKADAKPAKKRPSDAAMSGRIATLALLVLFALTFVVVWVAG